MRGLKSFLLLLVIAGGLGAYIWFVEMERDPNAPEPIEKVFEVESDQIQALRITNEAGETSVLARDGQTWTLSAPARAEADATEVGSITASLAALERKRVVDEQPASLTEYGLDTPRFRVAFTGPDGQERTLLVGNKTAMGGDLYAKLESEPRVFLIAGYLEETLNLSPFRLRDKAVLQFPREQVTSVDLEHGGTRIALSRRDSEWRISAPIQANADFAAAEGVLGRITAAQMQEIVDAPDLAALGLANPRATISVTAGPATDTLAIGNAAGEGRVYARDASRDLVFVVDQALVDELTKPLAEFRVKDVFAFRTFTIDRLEVTRDGTTVAFEKQSGESGDTWKRVTPSAGDVDADALNTALNALTALRVDGFVDVPAPGPDVVTVKARYSAGDDRREETVTFRRAGDVVHALMPGEPGSAVVSAAEFDKALAAMDPLLKTS